MLGSSEGSSQGNLRVYIGKRSVLKCWLVNTTRREVRSLSRTRFAVIPYLKMIHQLRLMEEYFQAIKNGSKTIEARLYKPKYEAFAVGDQVEFTSSSGATHRCTIQDIQHHDTFSEMLHKIEIQGCIPFTNDHAVALQVHKSIYREQGDEERKYGVIAIYLGSV